jgi:hypothetical protein
MRKIGVCAHTNTLERRKANNGRQGNTRRPFSLSLSLTRLLLLFLTSQFIFFPLLRQTLHIVSRSIFYFCKSLSLPTFQLMPCWMYAALFFLLLLLYIPCASEIIQMNRCFRCNLSSERILKNVMWEKKVRDKNYFLIR